RDATSSASRAWPRLPAINCQPKKPSAASSASSSTTSSGTTALCMTSSERVDARDLAADDELVHGFRALVGDHRLEVQRMTDRAVFGGDAGAAEDVAALARDVDRHAHVVP